MTIINKIILSILVVALVSSCVSVKDFNSHISSLHSVEELHVDTDKVYSQLQKWHPKLYQYISKKDLDEKFDALKKSIDRPMGSKEFYERLAVVVSEVRQGHMNVRPPGQRFTKQQQRILKKRKFEFYDLDFEILENKFWVQDARGKDSILIGDEVLAIETESISKLLTKYKRLFSSDGYNTTYHNRFVANNFRTLYYFDKGFKDSVTLLLKRKDSIYFRTFRRIGKGETGSVDSLSAKKTVAVSKSDKIAKKAKLKAKKKAGKKRGYVPARDFYLRNFDFIGKNEAVGYLKIRGFGDGNYKRFYKETFAKIDSTKIKNLIIDLRDNGGGSLDEIENLYGYLSLTPFHLVNDAEINTRIPLTKSFFSKKRTGFFNKALPFLIAPGILVHDLMSTRKSDGKLYRKFAGKKLEKLKKNGFKGKIYVLINGYSFSASSILSANLQATKRAMFIGEETGGSYNGTVAGQTKYVVLPNSKVRLNFGLMQVETPHRAEPDGYGIIPDVEIIPTPENRLDKIDPELQWVLDTISRE